MKNPEVDAFIAKSADFAKPILEHFRVLVHELCPDVQEKIKWGFPHFDYKDSPMCHMAAFKNHCAIGFWKAALMGASDKLIEKAKTEEAMGHLGKISSLKDLPKDKVLASYIKGAMKLNDKGIKLSAKNNPKNKLKPSQKIELEVPDYFKKALSKNKKAQKTFEEFSNSNKKEYLTWITEAKTETTRISRLETAIVWMSEGKIRNWKYLKK